jgi:hypothetical protein
MSRSEFFWVLALLKSRRDNCQVKNIQDNRVGHRRVGPTYGFVASPEVGSVATISTLQTGYPYILSQDKEQGVHPCALQHRTLPPSQGGLRGYHMSSGSVSLLPDRKGFGATTCPVYRGSGPHLPAGESSGAPRVL